MQVLATGQLGAKGIAVDDEAIYWVRDDNGTVGGSTMSSCRTDVTPESLPNRWEIGW